MADLFATGIQIPNIPTGQARASDMEGFLRVYLKNGKWFGVDHNGVDYEISPAGSVDQNVFIQDDPPTADGPYLWIQTNFMEPGGLTFWVEDGQNGS